MSELGKKKKKKTPRYLTSYQLQFLFWVSVICHNKKQLLWPIVALTFKYLSAFSFDARTSDFWLHIYACPADNFIIILGFPAHVLLASEKQPQLLNYTLRECLQIGLIL